MTGGTRGGGRRGDVKDKKKKKKKKEKKKVYLRIVASLSTHYLVILEVHSRAPPSRSLAPMM
jgi:hypothetical protein